MDEGSKQEVERSLQEANMDGMQNIQVLQGNFLVLQDTNRKDLFKNALLQSVEGRVLLGI